MPTSVIIIMYLTVIVAANFLVFKFGQPALVVTAVLFIPFDLTSRDVLHERWRGKYLWLKLFILICTGSLITFILNRATYGVAIASCSAFAIAGLVDAVVYQSMYAFKKSIKMNVSNIASSITDSIVFPLIAFGGVNYWLSASQSVLKIIGGAVWVFIFIKVIRNSFENKFKRSKGNAENS